jgi:hypothetical protein
MKNFTFISAIVLSLQFINAQADGGYTCRNFTGNVPTYPTHHETLGDLGLHYNADACAIVTAAKGKYLPDIVLAEPVPFPLCFSSKYIGYLDGNPVLVTADSGITQNILQPYLNEFSPPLPDITAVTVITINKLNGDGVNNYTLGRKLASVYTQDTLLNLADAPREYITVVGGSQQAKGHFVIEGDAANGPTPVEGRLCFLESHDSHD